MEEETEPQTNNLPKVKIFSTLQVHHVILAFIIHNKYISNYICIHTYYIHILCIVLKNELFYSTLLMMTPLNMLQLISGISC